MSEDKPKTLALRLDTERHARLSALAALEDISLTEAIKSAIDLYVDSRKNAPELTAKADEALKEIEREASSRREAISALFGDDKPTGSGTKAPAKKKAPGRRSSADS